MTVTKETVPLEGALKGEGYERKCCVRATRRFTYADECSHPLYVSYSRCEIEDRDDFPDGDYELIVGGQKMDMTRTEGRYVARCFQAVSVPEQVTRKHALEPSQY